MSQEFWGYTANRNIKNFETALLLYCQDHGRFPTVDEGLKILLKRQKINTKPYIWGSEKRLVDPWGEKYVYQQQKGIYKITCYGPEYVQRKVSALARD